MQLVFGENGSVASRVCAVVIGTVASSIPFRQRPTSSEDKGTFRKHKVKSLALCSLSVLRDVIEPDAEP